MAVSPLSPDAIDDASLVASGRRVVEIEQAALGAVGAHIGAEFAAACRLILASRGRVVATGMGKSGHVARKIAATLASTGTPAFYVHPGEAGHGDLGMITDADVVLALSYSGESDEILMLLPVLKRQGNAVIAMTGRAQSTLAREADLHLDVSVRPKPARWTWRRPPAPPPRWRWAMRWRWRCWTRAASPPTISPARTRPAAWAGACCCTSPT
jgi:arabinose-5-phosphate isomerase